MRIFVSSSSEDLKDHRTAAIRALLDGWSTGFGEANATHANEAR